MLCPTADLDNFGVRQGPAPDGHVVDQPVESGLDPAVLPTGADQAWDLVLPCLADRVFFIDRHAIDEQLELRTREPNDDVVPACRTKALHGKTDSHQGVRYVIVERRLLHGRRVRSDLRMV